MQLTLQFSGNSLFYGLNNSISLNDTNIPPVLRDFRSDVYWRVEVLDYTGDGSLKLKVLSYRADMSDFLGQVNLAKKVSKISFFHIDLRELLRSNKNTSASALRLIQEQIRIKIPYVNLTYEDGSVSFFSAMNEYSEFEVRVNNPFIRKEFEPISNYFAKVLGSEKAVFDLSLSKIVDHHGSVQAVQVDKASSQEIDRLDSSLVENVACAYSLDFLDSSRLENPHELRTPEQFIKEALGVDQHLDAATFLEKAFEFKGGKHRNQLKYLAGKHLSEILSLRFTPEPFSFLFLIPGRDKYFLVLEAFDAELATYLWSVGKSSDAALEKLNEVEQLMSAFADRKRESYISTKPEGFNRIFHNYKNDIDGYNAWREKLDTIIEG